MNSQNPLPYLLRYFRKKNGYTQDQIAAMLSIARSSYANYELGRSTPDIQQIVKLSQILEHDFLFAYTLSMQSLNSRRRNVPDAVYEDSPYKSLQDDVWLPYELSSVIGQLKTPDLELLQMYAELRIKQEQEEKEQNKSMS